MTAGECIRNAHLDWGVAKVPLRLNDEGGLPLSGLSELVRTDRPVHDQTRILGIVGDEYQPLQNWDAFRFFDAAVGDERHGTKRQGQSTTGKQIWLLASLGEGTHVRPLADDARRSRVLSSLSYSSRSTSPSRAIVISPVLKSAVATILPWPCSPA